MHLIRTTGPENYSFSLWNESAVTCIDIAPDGTASFEAGDEDGATERYYCITETGKPCTLEKAIVDLDSLKKPKAQPDNGESGWERLYRSLMELPQCNDCGALKECAFKPDYGETVRINCPLWEAKK